MVFVKGEDGSMKKYACVTCIKGHRSTACQHAGRELVEVRKKGRPVSQCAECRNLRKTKQVHIKCMCPKKRSGTKGRASPEKSPDVKMGTGMPPSTSSEAGSIATATASTATSPSSSPSRRLSVIESIDSDRLDLDLEGKTSARLGLVRALLRMAYLSSRARDVIGLRRTAFAHTRAGRLPMATITCRQQVRMAA
ncbi:copper fist DNA binding domain-containing protein [Gongronella butleri]|nr:copper fist DNA binding domain-containing protein [Gongronella butleri]